MNNMVLNFFYKDIGNNKRKYANCRCESCEIEFACRADCNTATCKKCSRIKHGVRYTDEYKVLKGMKERCINPKHDYIKKYYNHVDIYNEWIDNPEKFVHWCRENGYSKGLHIHRIDSNKGYNPDNCIFITAKEHMAIHSRVTNMNTARIIRGLYFSSNTTYKKLSKTFNVSIYTVGAIIRNETYKEN
jgi:hypothetical protein